jgi:heme A synthase
VLLCLQIVIGAYTVWTKTAVFFATAHVATGALLLATSALLTLRVFRLHSSAGRSVEAPRAAAVPSVV